MKAATWQEKFPTNGRKSRWGDFSKEDVDATDAADGECNLLGPEMVRKNFAVEDVPKYIGADDEETDEEIQRGDSNGRTSSSWIGLVVVGKQDTRLK